MNFKIDIIWSRKESGLWVLEKQHQANSLVKAYAQAMIFNLSIVNVASVIDTGNISRTISGYTIMNAIAGDHLYGIVVGTGTNAVTISDYALQTKIAHGTVAGKLSYGAVVFPANVTVAGSTCYFDVTRPFTNGSGSSITINEVGIYAKSSTGFYYCFDRTLSTVTIADGETKTATYRLSFSV